MAERIYLDSNVLISLLREEIGSGFRLLSVEAQGFFYYVEKNDCLLILSELFFREVKTKLGLNRQSISEYFNFLKINFEETNFIKNDFIKSKEIEAEGIHFPDSLHVALAFRTKSDCIATFNVKDFKKISNKIKVMEPKDFT